jgi:shikimate dehydrogenase
MNKIFLFGSDIAYSLSPAMHNAALQAMRLDWHYALWDLTAAGLREAVASLRAQECIGANVTIPYKEAVLEWIDELGAAARDVHAVNTIVKRGERLVGENTDLYGFLQALQAAAFDPRDAHAVILGAGGAARSVAFALAQAGAAGLAILNRTRARAQELAERLHRHFPCLVVAVDPAEMPPTQLVVNTLPRHVPVDLAGLPWEQQVLALDLTYRPAETPFMRAATLAGARAVNGLAMLVYQGAVSLEMWTRRPAPVDVMFEAAHRAMEA